VIEDAGAPDQAAPQAEEPVRFRLAFISYASVDRADVIARVQGLQVAGIRYFQDLLSLEPGDRFEWKIERQIDECDLFVLFWSSAAKKSEWVRREVRRALDRQSRDLARLPEIRPIIIGPPPPESPWPEVAHLHFNDLLSYVLSIEQNAR
jgi:TIR domain